jgi:hypothetical protein
MADRFDHRLGGMTPTRAGRWVRFADHEAELAEARKRWEAEQTEAMRGEQAETLVIQRIEGAGVNHALSASERQELAEAILRDLTSPQIEIRGEK